MSDQPFLLETMKRIIFAFLIGLLAILTVEIVFDVFHEGVGFIAFFILSISSGLIPSIWRELNITRSIVLIFALAILSMIGYVIIHYAVILVSLIR